jgi:hypothetical protein
MNADRSVLAGGKGVLAFATLHRTRAACTIKRIKLEASERPVGPDSRFTCADVAVSATWAEVPHIEIQSKNRHTFGYEPTTRTNIRIACLFANVAAKTEGSP